MISRSSDARRVLSEPARNADRRNFLQCIRRCNCVTRIGRSRYSYKWHFCRNPSVPHNYCRSNHRYSDTEMFHSMSDYIVLDKATNAVGIFCSEKGWNTYLCSSMCPVGMADDHSRSPLRRILRHIGNYSHFHWRSHWCMCHCLDKVSAHRTRSSSCYSTRRSGSDGGMTAWKVGMKLMQVWMNQLQRNKQLKKRIQWQTIHTCCNVYRSNWGYILRKERNKNVISILYSILTYVWHCRMIVRRGSYTKKIDFNYSCQCVLCECSSPSIARLKPAQNRSHYLQEMEC